MFSRNLPSHFLLLPFLHWHCPHYGRSRQSQHLQSPRAQAQWLLVQKRGRNGLCPLTAALPSSARTPMLCAGCPAIGMDNRNYFPVFPAARRGPMNVSRESAEENVCEPEDFITETTQNETQGQKSKGHVTSLANVVTCWRSAKLGLSRPNPWSRSHVLIVSRRGRLHERCPTLLWRRMRKEERQQAARLHPESQPVPRHSALT